MKQTPNYNLPQFEGLDKFTKEDFNDAFSKIDIGISDIQETINNASGNSMVVLQEVIEARKGEENLPKKIEKIDKDISNVNSQLEKNKQELSSTGLNAKFPLSPLIGIKADGVTDDSDTLNNLIRSASLNGKKLILPHGTICISKPLFFQMDASNWGVEIEGIKSETKYQNLPGSSATIIKAIANIPYMVSNRNGSLTSYYNVLKNVVLDGNNLAEIGYLNGYQDKVENTTILRCTNCGIKLSDYTNMTLIKEVTLVKNTHGLISDGEQSTVWTMEKCTVRENTQNGFVIESSLGANINNTIIESNGGIGVLIKGGTNILKYVNGLNFNNCYWENNTEYDIEIDRTGTVSPKNINFEKPFINGGTNAINIKYGNFITINKPMFEGVPSTLNYISVNEANNVVIISDENTLAPGNLNISGASAKNVALEMEKTTGTTKGKVLNTVIKAPIIKPDRIAGGVTTTLTEYQVAGTILVNAGQTGETTVTLPKPTENYSFKVICTTSSSFKWRIKSSEVNTIYFNGDLSPKSYVEIANPTIGACLEFIAFRDSNGTYDWLCIPHIGTWVSGI